MARKARIAPGGLVYHVLGRAVARLLLFGKQTEFGAFERVMPGAPTCHPTRIWPGA